MTCVCAPVFATARLKTSLCHCSRIWFPNLEAQQTERPLVTEPDAALCAALKIKGGENKDTRKKTVSGAMR